MSRKNGILRVSREYQHELEIIATTALAMYGQYLALLLIEIYRTDDGAIEQLSNDRDEIIDKVPF